MEIVWTFFAKTHNKVGLVSSLTNVKHTSINFYFIFKKNILWSYATINKKWMFLKQPVCSQDFLVKHASKYYLWMKNKQILTSSISKKPKCRFIGCGGNKEQFIFGM